MKYDLLHTEIYQTPCPECKAISFPITNENLSNYFHGIVMKCPKCDTKLDWWSLLLRHFDWDFPSYTYAIVGGYTTSLRIYMKAGEIFILDLEKIGIPKESKILQTSYTPNGEGLFPVELHGNTPVRHYIPNIINLYGRQFGEPEEETPVAVQINWAEKSAENEIWENIISAVEAFTAKNYNACVIPSNVSVESTLNNLMTKYFSPFAPKDKVEDFLSNGATYSYQLNILLPLVAHNSDFPKMPDNIRGSLNRLRGLRNSLAHRGKTAKQIDKKTISELICSSAFGLSYLNLLQERIDKREINCH
ncbi:hypothetical protein [Flavobacterium aquicola]|uniref:Apea-like HEPN domain-containing protein n=1 Tax=Flavobacterium aquicola TaxID=1682742 RepID=A0A3E0DVE6_9FLAO|nr:hypothetical protein [Flavobacterium aquicola]REG88567.1 hypothetical protein C8P67_1324 [Flavobacterium aquicola]